MVAPVVAHTRAVRRDERVVVVRVGVREARQFYELALSNVEELDVPELAPGPPRRDCHVLPLPRWRRGRGECVHPRRRDPLDRPPRIELRAVHAPPPVAAAPVEIKRRIRLPARPPAALDDLHPPRPVGRPEHVDVRGELLHLTIPTCLAGGGDGGPFTGGRDGGAKVGDTHRSQAAGLAGAEMGGVDSGPAVAGGGEGSRVET
ncbi:hypothetical protein QJS10_CPB13g00746 [Acorus calamus]|uniref:Uncharacterized protein n=1 Tax=Acorus calamus TaxID=4465 RepID=A0AAV9DKU3_ACOCL|nr:hypothetical protein QJS10_CPB13g00746 [Acorus calamus]